MLDEARDKIMMGVERKSLVQSLEARKLTAYHEGGHALVALKTQGANPIHKATIIPRGHALGMVTQVPDKDEFSITREQMLAYIDVCMGGKVAEELIFGEMKVTSGATQDLVQATRMARHMVADCGMSDLIGPMHVQTLMDHERSGGVLREHVDAEVARVLRESYERVKSMLTTNEQQLHTLAGALLEHETLTQKDIRDVLDGSFTSVPPEGPASSDSGAPKQEEEEGVELEHIPAGAAASVITPSPPTSPVAA
jgi:ATP-dependent metalloprotease